MKHNFIKNVICNNRMVLLLFSVVAILYAGRKPPERLCVGAGFLGDEELNQYDSFADSKPWIGVVRNSDDDGDWFDYESNTNEVCYTYVSRYEYI